MEERRRKNHVTHVQERKRRRQNSMTKRKGGCNGTRPSIPAKNDRKERNPISGRRKKGGGEKVFCFGGGLW